MGISLSLVSWNQAPNARLDITMETFSAVACHTSVIYGSGSKGVEYRQGDTLQVVQTLMPDESSRSWYGTQTYIESYVLAQGHARLV